MVELASPVGYYFSIFVLDYSLIFLLNLGDKDSVLVPI